jgi:hypothetical protein
MGKSVGERMEVAKMLVWQKVSRRQTAVERGGEKRKKRITSIRQI